MKRTIRTIIAVALLLVVGLVVRERIRHPRGAVITPLHHTDLVHNPGDAADDPAIWIHPADPTQSVILGTDKKGGLVTYDLTGRELQYLADGALNNVDLRGGFATDDGEVTLIAASDNDADRVMFYTIDPTSRRLTRLAGETPDTGIDAEGIALHRSKDTGKFYVFVVGDSEVDQNYWLSQWEVGFANGGIVTLPVRSLRIGSKSEACEADDEAGLVYVAEENVGIWRYPADPASTGDGVLMCGVGWPDPLRHDVEGLAIVESGRGRLLVASSQGSDDFVALDLTDDDRLVGRFRLQGTEHTDGIAIVSTPLGPQYPRGLFVAQNGAGQPQNFTLASWASIEQALQVDPR